MGASLAIALGAAGLLTGFIAGLIGIGGGVLIVPLLYFFYAHPEWTRFAFPESLHVTVAHATSLLVIFPTAVRGTLSYSKVGLIAWEVVIPVASAALLGGFLGARIAILAPAELLKALFGCFLIASAIQLVFGRAREAGGKLRTNLLATSFTGLAVGVLSGMMGVGGGILALPLLMYLLHVDLRRAAATSLAIVGAAAASGLVTYALSGMGNPNTPAGSLGYVHLYAAAPILVGAVLAVPLGARANQKLHLDALKWVFAAFFFVMGLKFLIDNGRALLP
ncbi:MAG: sulfite exporter TauE/SafE family protein [Gemmatimonadota bacterium]